MKIAPWHSSQSDVWHDDDQCNTGNNIEAENRVDGEAGRYCEECAKLAPPPPPPPPPPPEEQKLLTGSMGVEVDIAEGFGKVVRASWCLKDRKWWGGFDPQPFLDRGFQLLPTFLTINSTEKAASAPLPRQAVQDGTGYYVKAWGADTYAIVVLNEIEWTNDWTGTIPDYLDLMTWIKASSGGVKVAGPASMGASVLAAAQGRDTVNAGKAKDAIDTIKGVADYICIHQYPLNAADLVLSVAWTASASGLPVIINELGRRSTDVPSLQEVLAALEVAGAELVIFYPVAKEGPFVTAGKLTKTGQAVQDWVKTL